MPIRIDSPATPQPGKPAIPKTRQTPPLQPWLSREFHLFGKETGHRFKVHFYTELSVLLTAGMDVYQSLQLIRHSTKKAAAQQLIDQLANSILQGDSLSQAFQKTGRFSAYEVYSIAVGEETGQLIRVLEELTDHFTKTTRYRKQLTGALSYPVFVMGFALLVFTFLLHYLVPLFSDVYERFGGNLPTITVRIIGLSDWSRQYLGYLLLACLGIGAWLFSRRHSVWFRKNGATLLLHIPVIGSIVRDLFLARLCQSLYFLVAAGVPLTQAIRLIRNMIPFYPIEQSMDAAEKAIMNGNALHTSLSTSNFYPSQVIALLKVGEETGRLDKMLQQLALQYSERADQRISLIGNLLEPVLIIGVGFFVGIILIAMYLPLFKMSSTVQ